MSNIFICKHCDKELNIKQFGRHLWKIHQQKYEDYVGNNLEDFRHLNWKLCSKCGELFRGTSDKCGKCYTKTHQIKKDQFIECKICNRPIHSKVISIHLKSHHQIDFLIYINEHLADFEKMGWCRCRVCGNVTKKQGDKHSPTCSIECKSLILSKFFTGRKGHNFTEDEKKKISKSQKERLSNPENHPFYNKQLLDEHKKKISKTRIERGIARGEKNGMFGKTHTPDAIRKIFSHRKMNKLERLVADELTRAGIEYYFQFFIVENNICKSYDFRIKGKPLIIEVDGDFWHGNPKQKNHYEKVNEVRENDAIKDELAVAKGYKVVRLWETDIKKDPSIVLKYAST